MAARRLPRRLTLRDVYALSTGAMFSSGFFLLPGLAAAVAGTSVHLAYIAAGVLVVPAMLSVAELATGMPRAGGVYFFLERAFGPALGTVGGLGSWAALVLKSAFALLGMGAYLSLVLDVPLVPLALVLTAVFTVFNLRGVKEAAGLQRGLVYVLVGLLAVWSVLGLAHMTEAGMLAPAGPAFVGGVAGFASSVGLVFVSYAGLTKVASVAEEVAEPNRNIPLGMALSLLTAMVFYGLGVWLLMHALPYAGLVDDLTPIASAIQRFAPGSVGLVAVIVAASAAFASTANAGLMSAARYPLAMARDRLAPEVLGRLDDQGTPRVAVWLTAGAMALLIVAVDISAVAKLASAFQLLLFGLVCLAVIVMREARIAYYQPGFRSPLYPWTQIAGVAVAAVLIAQMGPVAWLAVAGGVAACLLWYAGYVRRRVARRGALHHVFARLGREADARLEQEMRSLLGERLGRDESEFEDLVARAAAVELPPQQDFTDALVEGTRALAQRVGVAADTLAAQVAAEHRLGLMPLECGVALPHLCVPGLERPELALVRAVDGIEVEVDRGAGQGSEVARVFSVLLLLSPTAEASRHFQHLARLAQRVEADGFMARWRAQRDTAGLKHLLLSPTRIRRFAVSPTGLTKGLVGRTVDTLLLPRGARLLWIRCTDGRVVPGGRVLQAGDEVTVAGEPRALADLRLGAPMES